MRSNENENAFIKTEKAFLIIGGGIKSAQAEQLIIQFAEKFNFPVLIAFRRHDVFPHNHPLFGHLGLGASEHIDKVLERL